MLLGGNNKARVYFRDRGVTDDLTGRAKYASKAAQSYKLALDKLVVDPDVVRQEIRQALAAQLDEAETFSTPTPPTARVVPAYVPAESKSRGVQKVSADFFSNFDDEEPVPSQPASMPSPSLKPSHAADVSTTADRFGRMKIASPQASAEAPKALAGRRAEPAATQTPKPPPGARNNPVAQHAYKHSLFDDDDAQKTQQKARDRLFDNALKREDDQYYGSQRYGDPFDDDYNTRRGHGYSGTGHGYGGSRHDDDYANDTRRHDSFEDDWADDRRKPQGTSRQGGYGHSSYGHEDGDWGSGRKQQSSFSSSRYDQDDHDRYDRDRDRDSARTNAFDAPDRHRSNESPRVTSTYDPNKNSISSVRKEEPPAFQATQRFANASSISSAAYYNRDERNMRRPAQHNYTGDLMDELVNVDLAAIGEGVLEVGSKLADYASDLFMQSGRDW